MVYPIVIVDDVREDALLAQRVIEHCGIRNPVHVFYKGSDCIRFFEGHPPDGNRTLPCLVLLDMVMAPMTGLDVLRELRQRPESTGSLFVMLSGMMDLKTIHAGYQLGAQTFLVKPLAADDMMQMLRAIPTVHLQPVEGGHIISILGPRPNQKMPLTRETRRGDEPTNYREAL